MRKKYFLLLLVSLLPLRLHADGFLPVAMVIWPSMILALIPVVLIEAWVYKRELKIKIGIAIKGSFLSNAFSTFLGYPLSAILWFSIGWLVLQPLSNNGQGALHAYPNLVEILTCTMAYDPSPIGILIGLASGIIPAFLISIWSKKYAMQKYLKHDGKEIGRAVWKANLFSYIFLIALTLALFIFMAARI
jgi:hypothetical protein